MNDHVVQPANLTWQQIWRVKESESNSISLSGDVLFAKRTELGTYKRSSGTYTRRRYTPCTALLALDTRYVGGPQDQR